MFSIFYRGKGGGGYLVVSGQWSVASGVAGAAGGRQESAEQQIPRRLKPARDDNNRGLGRGAEAAQYPSGFARVLVRTQGPNTLHENSVVPEDVGVAATRLPFLLSVTRGLRPGLTSRPPLSGWIGLGPGIFFDNKSCVTLRLGFVRSWRLLFHPGSLSEVLTAVAPRLRDNSVVPEDVGVAATRLPFLLSVTRGLRPGLTSRPPLSGWIGVKEGLVPAHLRESDDCLALSEERTANSERRIAKRGRLRPGGCHAC